MVETYRVGVISDTHGTPLPASVHSIFAGCDHILHAGDVGTSSARMGQAILDELEEIAPVTAVLGNSSSDREGAYYTSTGIVENSVSGLEIGGVRFYLTHNNHELLAWKQRKEEDASHKSAGPQVWIHGHTHRRSCQQSGATYTICPGSVYAPRDGNKAGVAMITIKNGGVADIIFRDL